MVNKYKGPGIQTRAEKFAAKVEAAQVKAANDGKNNEQKSAMTEAESREKDYIKAVKAQIEPFLDGDSNVDTVAQIMAEAIEFGVDPEEMGKNIKEVADQYVKLGKKSETEVQTEMNGLLSAYRKIKEKHGVSKSEPTDSKKEVIEDLSRFDIDNPENHWQDLTENILAREPNDPEIIEAVREKLSVPEAELVFRMMSESELKKILTNAVIGGEAIPGQVESGVTWWGDELGDALSQRRGKVRINENQGIWAGASGVMVAVRRSAIKDATVESRLRSQGAENEDEAGYDAYKTKGEIPASAIVDVFKIAPGLGEDAFFYKVEKLTT